mmetsp:Transcript_115246/g.229617  ORF Transcript_115246/g.229617 Transcript_115246/m.229617 type:complete len:137 (+) Transcript_115246:439-849(+)
MRILARHALLVSSSGVSTSITTLRSANIMLLAASLQGNEMVFCNGNCPPKAFNRVAQTWHDCCLPVGGDRVCSEASSLVYVFLAACFPTCSRMRGYIGGKDSCPSDNGCLPHCNERLLGIVTLPLLLFMVLREQAS